MADLLQAYQEAWEANYNNDIAIRKEKLKLLGSISVNMVTSASRDGIITQSDFNKRAGVMLLVPGFGDFGNEVFGKDAALPVTEFKARANKLVEKKVEDIDKGYDDGRAAYFKAMRKLAKEGDDVIRGFIEGSPSKAHPPVSRSPTSRSPSINDIMGGGKGR